MGFLPCKAKAAVNSAWNPSVSFPKLMVVQADNIAENAWSHFWTWAKIATESMHPKTKKTYKLLIKHTNINKQIYKNMFQINEKHRIWNLLCYVDFAYQTNTNINKQIYKHMFHSNETKTRIWNMLCVFSLQKHIFSIGICYECGLSLFLT